MSEGLRNQFTKHEFDVQPFDGLTIFRDSDFVERWIKSEQLLNKQLAKDPKYCEESASDDAEVLNALFRTDELGGKQVTVSGRVLQGDSQLQMRNAISADKVQFRYGQIKFIKVAGVIPNRAHIEQYRAAVKLLPLADFADAKVPAQYMLLSDINQLSFSETYETVFNPAEIDDVFSDILADGKKLRSRKSYQEKPASEKVKTLDARARQYAQRLAPLIDHRVPVLIDAGEYRKFSTKPEASGHLEPVDTRNMQPNQRARNMVAGHLTKLAFSNSAIEDVNVAPHLVIENDHNRLIYWVPLSTDFDIWTL